MVNMDYIAGFFDGEGSIVTTPVKGQNYRTWQVSMSNTHKAVLEQIRASLPTTFGSGHLASIKATRPNHTDYYSLQYGGRRLFIEVLELLTPHLVVKRERAIQELQNAREWKPIDKKTQFDCKECGQPAKALDLCPTHYKRVWRERKNEQLQKESNPEPRPDSSLS